MKIPILLSLMLFVLGTHGDAFAARFEVKEIGYLKVNSAITPATLDYLRYQFSTFSPNTLAVIKLNTPGGLVNTTKDIITLIGEQDFPVAVWVTPEGASASSAGAFIAASAHFILMTPGTNIGAATPVGLGSDLKESDGRKKALNDLKSLVRSLSHERGRPGAPFEKMINEADSFTAQESLKLSIINGIASNTAELKNVLNGAMFKHKGMSYELAFAPSLGEKEIDPSVGQKLLEVLADPSLAYFLFIIAVALIYFEFQAPGGYIAGSLGAGLLILAAISFQVLPLDWGALGLIFLGVVLLVLEVFIVSYGLLSIFGLLAFISGSLFLFHGDTGLIDVEYPVMFSTLAGVVFSVGIIVWYLYREQKKKGPSANFFLPVGAQGAISNVMAHGYQVKVKGETWRAIGPSGLVLHEQIEVIAVDQSNLTLHIKKSSPPY
jgi:membrane-bound serine protease (ClpP class)